VLRTRPPRSTPERARARLACIRHAASVDPEPGSNSPPMAPKSRSLRRAGRSKELFAPQRRSPKAPRTPAGILRLRVMATRCSGLLAVCERLQQTRPPVPQVDPPTIRSLRLRHPTSMTPEAHSLPPIPPPAPACQRATPLALTATGTADAATAASPAPTGRPFHVRGSLLTGARKAYPAPVTLSRVTSGCLWSSPVP
jgi:hypothetical protein